MDIGFFGDIGERIGREIRHDPAPGTATVAGLRRSLAAAFPAFADALLSRRLKVFIADRQVDEETSLTGVTRVEFLPPVSGG